MDGDGFLDHTGASASRCRKRRIEEITEGIPRGKTRTYVTMVGNYVRADADTAAAFFRDVFPKVGERALDTVLAPHKHACFIK